MFRWLKPIAHSIAPFLLLCALAFANPPATQQPLMLGVSGVGPAVLTWASQSSNSGGSLTYTYTSQAIGTASSDRVVAVCTGSGQSGSTPPTSVVVTIGGVTATQIQQGTFASGNAGSIGLYALAVSSGTTSTIVVTYSGTTQSRNAISVWALTGTGGVATPSASGLSVASGGSPKSISLTATAGGAALGCWGDGISGGTISTFSGVTSNFAVLTSPFSFASGSANGTSSGSLAISAVSSSPVTFIETAAVW